MIDAYLEYFDVIDDGLLTTTTFTDVVLLKPVGNFAIGTKFDSARFNHDSGCLTLRNGNDKHHIWFQLTEVKR